MRKAKIIQLPIAAAISIASLMGISSHAIANEANGARPVQLPPSLCTGAEADRKERRRQYLDDMQESICNNIDTTPNYQDSALRYESPEATKCNFDLSLPGLPSLAGTGIDTCGIVQDVTGDMVDIANEEMMGSINNALGVIEDKTGLTAGDFNTDANEIADGVENFTGLNNIKDSLERNPMEGRGSGLSQPNYSDGARSGSNGFGDPQYDTGAANPIGINGNAPSL